MSIGFTCPNCGGYKWGTSHCTESKDKWIGHCHGGDYFHGCGFTWHRMTDDEKILGVPLRPPTPGFGGLISSWIEMT